MNVDKKYIAVGATVLVACVLLVAMIFIFTGLPQWFTGGRTLKIYASQTHNLNPGNRIYLRGMKIGSVREVVFTDGDPAKGITIIASVDSDIKLPRKLKAQILRQGLAGMTSISLWAQPDSTEYYSPDETVIIDSFTGKSNSLLPPELTQAMSNFGQLAATLNEMLTETPAQPTAGTTQPTTASADQPSPGLRGTIVRLNRTLDSIYKITGNDKNQKNIETSLENLSTASTELKTVLADARKTLLSSHQLSRELITDAENLSKLLQSFQKTADAINDSKGTAGQLINDPKLYNSMVQTTAELQKLIAELRHMAEKWRRDGMGVKLK